MANLSVGKVDEGPLSEPADSRSPIIPPGPVALPSTFVFSIERSAKELHSQLRNATLPPGFEFVNFCLSKSKISIASISLDKFTVIKATDDEPIYFAVHPANLEFCLRIMIPGKEIRRLLFTYKAGENLLKIQDGRTKSSCTALPCTKEGNKLVIHLN